VNSVLLGSATPTPQSSCELTQYCISHCEWYSVTQRGPPRAETNRNTPVIRVANTSDVEYSVAIPLPPLQGGVVNGQIKVDATGDNAIGAGAANFFQEPPAAIAFALFDAAITGKLYCFTLPHISEPSKFTIRYNPTGTGVPSTRDHRATW
jgi:hypothetical protein